MSGVNWKRRPAFLIDVGHRACCGADSNASGAWPPPMDAIRPGVEGTFVLSALREENSRRIREEKRVRYVIGIRASTEYRTGGRRLRELDFVRLVLAVRTLTGAGSTAHGYLSVPDERGASRARRWQRKYAAMDLVGVLLHRASAVGEGRLREERGRDAFERTGRAPALPAASSASLGDPDSEEAFRAAIREREPGVVEVPSDTPPPLGVRWDYSGTSSVATHTES